MAGRLSDTEDKAILIGVMDWNVTVPGAKWRELGLRLNRHPDVLRYALFTSLLRAKSDICPPTLDSAFKPTTLLSQPPLAILYDLPRSSRHTRLAMARGPMSDAEDKLLLMQIIDLDATVSRAKFDEIAVRMDRNPDVLRYAPFPENSLRFCTKRHISRHVCS